MNWTTLYHNCTVALVQLCVWWCHGSVVCSNTIVICVTLTLVIRVHYSLQTELFISELVDYYRTIAVIAEWYNGFSYKSREVSSLVNCTPWSIKTCHCTFDSCNSWSIFSRTLQLSWKVRLLSCCLSVVCLDASIVWRNGWSYYQVVFTRK